MSKKPETEATRKRRLQRKHDARLIREASKVIADAATERLKRVVEKVQTEEQIEVIAIDAPAFRRGAAWALDAVLRRWGDTCG